MLAKIAALTAISSLCLGCGSDADSTDAVASTTAVEQAAEVCNDVLPLASGGFEAFVAELEYIEVAAKGAAEQNPRWSGLATATTALKQHFDETYAMQEDGLQEQDYLRMQERGNAIVGIKADFTSACEDVIAAGGDVDTALLSHFNTEG